VPLLARVYPNGSADVNQFQAAGGPGFVIRELLDAGLLHADVLTVAAGGLRAYAAEPCAGRRRRLAWRALPAGPGGDDASCARPPPFSADGGLKLLPATWAARDQGLGGARDRHGRGAGAGLPQPGGHARGVQGRRAGARLRRRRALPGPAGQRHARAAQADAAAGVLQGKGFKVALVTDGRMSGASGKVPAAIHVSPEARSWNGRRPARRQGARRRL
jgi:phosphogluconate dehydratase